MAVAIRQAGGIIIETLLDEHAEDALLGSLPERFPAQVTHVESVLGLPDDAQLLATSPGDPHHAAA